MPFTKGKYCCGFVPIKTGVVLITLFGILNKLSGFYGILSFDFTDNTATAGYVYSLLAIVIFVQGLYGLHSENVRTFRWYTMFFWLDSFISIIWTIHTGITWYIYTDHSLPELENDPAKKEEHDRVFDMEKYVGIAVLVALNLIHLYFAFIVTRFYKAMIHKSNYTKVPTEQIDLEERSNEAPPKQALD
ncbi:uncharacterized protein RHIMIDRAFT_278099 [Rhizopus microsporus ATCC 52813]|uniref:DUF1753-domain-containing protein n=2 Tax=Rhizopus microsporus TaxID=58291 RepID=A0A2G4SZ50_RHIZD|nr:uncharacterized protein RHIMIDRAFT_278099 [Rhizopus microsporus ATCC 52813]PHZ14053.1 hypothetical protein RHIMIDRAFT_278099 [Rhizopus microsporus ATCC 52813]